MTGAMKRSGLAGAQHHGLAIAQALLLAAGVDDDGAGAVDGKNDIVIAIGEKPAVARYPYRRRGPFHELQSRQRQAAVARFEHDARRRLDVDAKHHLAIMLAPDRGAIPLGNTVSRKLQNTRA